GGRRPGPPALYRAGSARTLLPARGAGPAPVAPPGGAGSRGRRVERQAQRAPAGPPVQRYHEGDRVSHPKFGRGVVMKSTLTRTDEELVVRFEATGVKILNGTIAPLTKV